jgi:sec-independent protein translocase protein TatA
MPGFISIQEVLVLMLVLLLLFGAKRLPELGRSLGHGMREFKDGIVGKGSSKQAQLPEDTTGTV